MNEEPTIDDVEMMLRDLDVSDLQLDGAPDSVWDAIEAELDTDAPTAAPATGNDNVVSFPQRRFPTWFAAAAAAIIAVVSVVAVVAQRDQGAIVASVDMSHDEGFDPLGAESMATAELVERDGAYSVRLTNTRLPDAGKADLELWLIATKGGEITDVSSVSLIANGDGTYDVPGSIDPNVNTIVDISIEPRDGDEAHSGRSILRGNLNA